MRFSTLFSHCAFWVAAWSSAYAQAAPLKRECLASYSSAQELRLNGSLLAARDELLVCSQRGCPGPIANDCAGWLGEVDAALPSAVFAVSDERGRDIAEARVSAGDRVLAERTDGRAVVLDPGTYTFRLEADGYVGAEQTVSMRQSEKNRIVRIQLRALAPAAVPLSVAQFTTAASEPDTTARGIPIASYVLGGVAVVGVGAFAYFGLRGLDAKKDADRCRSMCRELIDSGRRDYVIADIGLGVAIASASAALLVYFLTPDTPAARSTAALSTAALRVGGEF